MSLKKQQISNDSLTNLSNFNSIEALLEDKISEYANHPFDLYIVLLSIKNIKQISDIYGIIEGEKAITKVAECLEHLKLQNNYNVARYNSGGFIIVCEYIDENELKDFCNKTRNVLNDLTIEVLNYHYTK